MKKKNPKFFKVRSFIARKVQYVRFIIYRLKGYDIHSTTILERNINLDRFYPQGMHIGRHSRIASNTIIISHNHLKRVNGRPSLLDVKIGERCYIAVGAIILPGITIGNQSIVSAGAVVTQNVPPNCIVAGNPARIIREGIEMCEIAALKN